MKLAGKKAMVTGANRSIGQAIAIAFAQEGADVLISYRSDEEGAQKTIQAIEKMGRQGKAIYADFSEPQNIYTFFDHALNFLGFIDILINNAAAYNTTEFLKLNVKELDHLLKVNVIAPMVLTQLTAKHMIQEGIAGKIINISSISGERPSPEHAAYCTTKAALNMLTKNMALELAPYNIRVNAIAPGTTPYDKDYLDSSSIQVGIPLQRTGKPEDQAYAAVYLASNESSWLTGQIITIDGGQSLSF